MAIFATSAGALPDLITNARVHGSVLRVARSLKREPGLGLDEIQKRAHAEVLFQFRPFRLGKFAKSVPLGQFVHPPDGILPKMEPQKRASSLGRQIPLVGRYDR